MKKLLITTTITALYCLQSVAQTNAPTTPQQTFTDSVLKYFSSVDTNSQTFNKTHEIDLRTGMDYQNGLNLGAHLGLSYNINSFLSVGSETLNAGVAGTIVSQQVDLELNKAFYDIKITGYVGGGYDFLENHPFGSIGARVCKALTANTFSYVGLEGQFFDRSPVTPRLKIGVGVTF